MSRQNRSHPDQSHPDQSHRNQSHQLLWSIAVITALSLIFLPSAQATVSAGDACVWDSAVPDLADGAPPIFGIGGSGQVNGEFILDTVDLGASALQIGIRGQERFIGPTLTRVGNVYFADKGITVSGGGVMGATWNYDFHLDFGTSDGDTTVAGQSLESTLLRSLTALDMRDFDVELLVDGDASAATSFVITDLNAALVVPPFSADVRLFQSSQNLLFGGNPPGFDPDADGIYDFLLRVKESGTETVIAQVGMKVVVGDAPVDTVDLALSMTESIDPVLISSGNPGGLTYVTTVTNLGPGDATDVEISDVLTLPAGVSISSGPTPSAGSVSGAAPNFTWALAALSASASATLTVELTIADSAALGSNVITNAASVSAVAEPDSSLFNDSASHATSITCPDADGDTVCDEVDNCPATFNTDQADSDGDGSGNACDLCFGDDATGDSDADGVCDDIDFCTGNDLFGDADMDGTCADRDCDDGDPDNACLIFEDGFETGDTSRWM